MPEVRFARQEDFPVLAALEKRCFSDPWSRDAFARFAEADGVILVAEEGGETAGYITLLSAADEGEIANLATAPSARRRGVAGCLLRAGEEEMKKRGVRTLYLEVRVSNEGAVALYEKNGFAPAGRRKGFYRFPTEDALIYRKELL